MKRKPSDEEFDHAQELLEHANGLLEPVLDSVRRLRENIEKAVDTAEDRFTVLTIAIVILQAKLEAILRVLPLHDRALDALKEHLTEDILIKSKATAESMGIRWHDQ